MRVTTKTILLILCILIQINAWIPPSAEIKKPDEKVSKTPETDKLVEIKVPTAPKTDKLVEIKVPTTPKADKLVEIKVPTISSEEETINKILNPLYKSIESIDNLSDQIKSLSSEVDKVESLADKIDVSSIQNIKKPEIKSEIIAEFKKIIHTPTPLSKEKHLTKLEQFKSRLDINYYKRLTDTLEQLYFYKKSFNNVNNKFSEYKNKIPTMKQNIKNSITESETKLKEAKSTPGIDSRTIQQCETQFSDLKPQVLEKSNLLNEFKNIISTKINILNDIHKGLIAKLETVPALSEKIVQEEEKAAPSSEILSFDNEFQRGIYFFNQNNIKKAKKSFKKEISQNPDNWDARHYISKIYIKEKKYDQAVVEINEALKIFHRTENKKK